LQCLVFTADALAAWIVVAPAHRVKPEAIFGVEIVTITTTGTAAKEAVVATPHGRHLVRDSQVLGQLETLVADSAVWLTGKTETIGNRTTKRFARKVSILTVSYSCPTTSNCAAHLDGLSDAYSRFVVDDQSAIAQLKQLTAQATEFVLMTNPAAGFESFVRRSFINGVRFICPASGPCTQEDVLVPSTNTLITRDAQGIIQLQQISQ
jgi:hypothetical protein